jgi:hypothetical protein
MAHMRVCQTRYFVPDLRRHNFRVIEVSQTKLGNVFDDYQHYTSQLMPCYPVEYATYSASAKMRKTQFFAKFDPQYLESLCTELENILLY